MEDDSTHRDPCHRTECSRASCHTARRASEPRGSGRECPYLMARAEGTQNYVCVPTSSGHTWTFFGPQATLFGDGDQQVTTHFLSPNPAEGGTPRATWQHSGDTSTVWAAAIANSTDSSFVAPGAIPWLLLRVVGSEGWAGR